MSRYPYCACTSCWFVMARSAYSPDEFVRLAKRYRLNEAQQKIIDEIKLKLWNDATRGDIA